MNEKGRVLRNEIREIIDPANCMNYETQEHIINELFKKFHIIPFLEKNTALVIVNARGKKYSFDIQNCEIINDNKPEPTPRPDPGVNKNTGGI